MMPPVVLSKLIVSDWLYQIDKEWEDAMLEDLWMKMEGYWYLGIILKIHDETKEDD